MRKNICLIQFINIPWYETSDSAEKDPTENFVKNYYEIAKCETSAESDARLRKFFLNQAEIPECPIHEI